MQTRDETLLERLGAGAMTGGLMGTLAGAGATGLETAGKAYLGQLGDSSALRKFLLQRAMMTGKLGLGTAALTAPLSGLLHAIKGPRQVIEE